MLKTHLQPILAYFFNSANHSVDRQGVRQTNPLQPMVDYWSQSADQNDRPHSRSKVLQVLGNLWQQLTAVRTEPQIQQRFRDDQPYWQVYDPLKDQHHTFTSEAAVYRWLEHRYSE